MKNKLIILVLIFFSTTVMAETMLLIEQTDKQIVFISSNLKENDFQYYAMWSNKKNSCISTNPLSKSFPLKKEISLDNKYTFPNNHGFLCLRRSKELLPKNWNKYHVFTTIPLGVATQSISSLTSDNIEATQLGIISNKATSGSIATQALSSVVSGSIIINNSDNTHSKALDVDKKEIKISAVALSPETLKKEFNLLECKLREEKGYSFCQIKL